MHPIISVLPVLLALQQFPVGVDFHVKSQLDIQEFLVLIQLGGHPVPQLAHFHFLPLNRAAVLVLLRRQELFELSGALFRSGGLINKHSKCGQT